MGFLTLARIVNKTRSFLHVSELGPDRSKEALPDFIGLRVVALLDFKRREKAAVALFMWDVDTCLMLVREPCPVPVIVSPNYS